MGWVPAFAGDDAGVEQYFTQPLTGPSAPDLHGMRMTG